MKRLLLPANMHTHPCPCAALWMEKAEGVPLGMLVGSESPVPRAVIMDLLNKKLNKDQVRLLLS